MFLPATPSPNSPTPPLVLPDAFSQLSIDKNHDAHIAELEERLRQLQGAATLLRGAGIQFPNVAQAAQYLVKDLDVFHRAGSKGSSDAASGETNDLDQEGPDAVAAMSGIIGSDLSRVLNGSLVTQLEEEIESLKGQTRDSTENGDSSVEAWEKMTTVTTRSGE